MIPPSPHAAYVVRRGDPPTPEQRATLQALAAGCGWDEAARQLHVGRRTLGHRLARLRDRCGCATTAQLMALAGARGWVRVAGGA